MDMEAAAICDVLDRVAEAPAMDGSLKSPNMNIIDW